MALGRHALRAAIQPSVIVLSRLLFALKLGRFETEASG
jgi:hypothetical protein